MSGYTNLAKRISSPSAVQDTDVYNVKTDVEETQNSTAKRTATDDDALNTENRGKTGLQEERTANTGKLETRETDTCGETSDKVNEESELKQQDQQRKNVINVGEEANLPENSGQNKDYLNKLPGLFRNNDSPRLDSSLEKYCQFSPEVESDEDEDKMDGRLSYNQLEPLPPVHTTNLIPKLKANNKDTFWHKHLYSKAAAISAQNLDNGYRKKYNSDDQLAKYTHMAKRPLSFYSDDIIGGVDKYLKHLNEPYPTKSLLNISDRIVPVPHSEDERYTYRSHLIQELRAQGKDELFRFPQRAQKLLKYRQKRGIICRNQTQLPKLKIKLNEKNQNVTRLKENNAYSRKK